MNMKQVKFFFTVVVLSLYVNVSGQSVQSNDEKNSRPHKMAKTYLDLMVNVTSTSINYGNKNHSLSDFKKPSNGIQAGATFQAGITPAFSLVSEVYFIRKGGELKTGNPLTTTEWTLRMNSIELPVLARLHAGRLYANAGPSLAFNLSGKREIDGKAEKVKFNKAESGYKRFDAGIQVGGGLMFPVKSKVLAIDVRYVYGLTNISRSSEVYNRTLMISVHYSQLWKTNPLGRK